MSMNLDKVREDIKVFFRHRIPNLALVFSMVLVVGGWLWAYFKLRKITEPLIIHYSQEVGIDQVGYAGDLAKVGIFGIVIVAINFIISVELEQKDRFLGRLTSTVTSLLGILIFIYFAAIIGVN